MTPEAIARIIEGDIANAGADLLWGGRPLHECLRVPTKLRHVDSHRNEDAGEFWLVFEECSEPGRGYTVVYDEDLNQFGLGLKDQNELMFLGFYGGFVKTLNSM